MLPRTWRRMGMEPRNPDGIVTAKPSQKKILAAMRDGDPGEPFCSKDVAKHAGIADATARKNLKKLAESGEIVRKEAEEANWVAYYIPPEADT